MNTNEIFELLGSCALKSVVNIQDWDRVCLKIKRLDKNVGFETYYYDKESNIIPVDTNVNYETAKSVNKLYEITQNHTLEHKKWNRAVFTITFDNIFEIEYIWDQQLQDEVDGYNNNLKPTI